MPRRKSFGLLDMTDRLWLGNVDGPWTFESEQQATARADTEAPALGWPRERIKVHPIDAGSYFKLRDEVEYETDPPDGPDGDACCSWRELDGEDQLRSGPGPSEESPAYREAMKGAGRGHLLR